LEDVVVGPFLGDYRTMIRSRPCHVVVLLPAVEAVAAREQKREDKGYSDGWTVEGHHADFVRTTPRVGLWLDTTEQTPEQTVDEILERTTSEGSPFVVVAYDEGWPALFEELAAPVRSAVADLGAEVEHVGSTAVPGLAAKPIVDLDVVVHSPDDVAAAIERLCGLGYTYQGDKGIPGREALLWPPGTTRHHLYVVVAGSEPLQAHLAFRDHLREHPEVAEEYGALKRRLADEYRDDRLGYTEAKSEFVLGVLQRCD
ncbi:MAG TPA: GrpB family protein, partial [Gaiellaceae bacterium]